MKIRFLFSSIFLIGPKSIPCEKGQIMDVSYDDAFRLIDGLCAEPVMEDEPPIEIVVEKPKRKRKVTSGDR